MRSKPMSYCLNPHCLQPENPDEMHYCANCGSNLLLKDRYRTLKPLGQGGFGKTFLAIDEDKPSKPYCVIKQFFPLAVEKEAIAKAAELFAREAQQLETLGSHPQIPNLLAYFSLGDRQYLVQEFIEGENLAREVNKAGQFDEIQVRSLLDNLLPILQFVHDRQVIHRNIKPENLIDRHSDRLLFLVDFGASKIIDEEERESIGTAIGSAGYSPPEQAIGRSTYASDIYSLGVTCINLLTGLHPFDLFDVSEGKWVWREHLKQKIREEFARILDKMLMPAISQRYTSIEELRQDLRTIPNAIDLSLERLQTEFLGKKTSPIMASSSIISPTQIDLELQELQSDLEEENSI